MSPADQGFAWPAPSATTGFRVAANAMASDSVAIGRVVVFGVSGRRSGARSNIGAGGRGDGSRRDCGGTAGGAGTAFFACCFRARNAI